MKAIPAVAALFLALALAGCSAGVGVGSATYRADDRGETLCTNSYGASVNAPDAANSGVHRQRGCVRRDAGDSD